MASAAMIQCCPFSTDAVTHSMWTNEHGCVLIKLYLWTPKFEDHMIFMSPNIFLLTFLQLLKTVKLILSLQARQKQVASWLCPTGHCLPIPWSIRTTTTGSLPALFCVGCQWGTSAEDWWNREEWVWGIYSLLLNPLCGAVAGSLCASTGGFNTTFLYWRL